MSHWNYRIIRKSDSFVEGGEMFGIHEVYYHDDGTPRTCTVDPVEPVGETRDELKDVFGMFRLAFDKPVLDYERDFTFSTAKGKRNLPAIPRKGRRVSSPQTPHKP
jgi:hypothetical protein